MIYLDNAATSFPKAPGVAEGVAWQINNVAGNPGRASYKSSLKIDSVICDVREKIVELLKLEDSSQVIITHNATHALNMVILGSIKPNETILISPLEHNSVMRPLSFLQQNRNIKLEYYKLGRDFTPDFEDLTEKLRSGSIDKVITTVCSNVTGTILPLQEISKICKANKIPLIVDASQLVGYEELDFSTISVSAICFPGHKGLLAPSGTGILWLAKDFEIDPLYFGGTGSRSGSILQPDFTPDKYESGTVNISGIYGLNIALDYLMKESVKKVRSTKNEIVEYLLTKMNELEEIIIYSNQDLARQIGVISFNCVGTTCSDVARFLDKQDIAVRMGLHCSPQAHQFINTLKLGGTVRLSPSYFTTQTEIDITINKLKEMIYGINN